MTITMNTQDTNMYNINYIITQGIHRSVGPFNSEFRELYEWAIGDLEDGRADPYEIWNRRHKVPIEKKKHLYDKIQNTFENAVEFIVQVYGHKKKLKICDTFNLWTWAFGRSRKDLTGHKMLQLWKDLHPELPDLVIPDTDLQFLDSCVFTTAYIAFQVVKYWNAEQAKENKE